MTNRVFTDQELEEMEALTLDLLTKAIESDDKERAKSLAEQMYQESLQMHDMYVDWTTGFMDWIYKNYGDDALLQAERKVLGDFVGKLSDIREIDFKLMMMGMVNWLKGHQQPLKVVEDDEKVCVTMVPCGSGERLIQRGRCEPPWNFSMIQRPQPMTGGKIDLPVYCTHEPVIEMLTIEQLGYPISVCFTPEKVGREGGCRFCMYKNVKDIPEEVWTRVGMQKPDNL